MAASKRYWLFKTEPDTYSVDDLARDGATFWDGVRNYQARNMLRDDVAVGDGVLLYHSSTKPMAVVALCEVVEAGSPDPTQFDAGDPHYDAGADPAAPRWYGVRIALGERLPRPVTLAEIKAEAVLADMTLVQRGSRLSIQPVTAAEWRRIVALGRRRA
ncbi:MAG: EVE domain-containing protein [Planctomycetota bacterium]